jgi:hypothetical protein
MHLARSVSGGGGAASFAPCALSRLHENVRPAFGLESSDGRLDQFVAAIAGRSH